MCECYKEANSGDGCDLSSTLCRYDLRKDYLFRLANYMITDGWLCETGSKGDMEFLSIHIF